MPGPDEATDTRGSFILRTTPGREDVRLQIPEIILSSDQHQVERM
jgi:hypothetical protein